MSNLQVIARRCPVMSKALAVQSARMRTAGFSTAAPGAASLKSAGAKAKIHTTAEKKANVETVYRKGERG